ncbi:hypothetical protein G6F57_011830 [Rhizopus arrhizus]|nr:hypothetical protein G6F57_011830 [Rhizopus arrhizus]
MRIVTEKVVRGGLPQDKAVEELDQRVDKVLAKRRWMHEQQRLQQRAPSPQSSSAQQPALRRPGQLHRSAADTDVLEVVVEHHLLRADRRAVVDRRVAGRGDAAQCTGSALQGAVPHRAVRPGGDHPGGGGSDLALPVPYQLRAGELRTGPSGHQPDRLAGRSQLGDADHHAVRGVEELRLQHGRAHRRRLALEAVPAHHPADARPGAAGGRGHYRVRLLPAVRRALRDDPWRPAAEHRQRAVFHVRGRLQVVEPGTRLRGGVPAVPDHPGGDHRDAAFRPQEAVGMSREIGQSRWYPWMINGALLVLALVSLAPLLWMVSVSFMPQGEASHFPPPLLPSSITTHNYHELFARTGMGGNFANSLLVSLGITIAELRRPRASVPGADGRAGYPGAGGDAAAVPADEAAGPGQQFRRRDRAGAGQRVRYLPGPPVRAFDPGRAAGSGAHRRGRGAAHLLPDRSADAQAGAGDLGDLHFHGRVERFHVAVDRVDRPGALHFAGGTGHPLARTHHGRGNDDGRRGGHRGPGAGAVPGAAAVLHTRSVAGERQRMKRAIAVGLGLLWTSLAIAAPPALPAPKVLDDFDDIGAWKLVLSDQVSGSLRPVSGAGGGRALCLDYDFHKVSGYVGIRRALNIEYPVNYRFGFQLRGDSPGNDLQFKLIDASGDNVWWVNRPGYSFPKAWTPVEYRRRQIDKAWGPSPEKEMARSAAVEFTIYSKVGGRGTVCFDRLTLQGLPPQDDSALVPSVIADTATALQDRMIDGKSDTFWISGGVKQQTISLDLHKSREIGGAVVDWLPDLEARRYTVRTSEDGRDWRTVREVTSGAGGRDWLALPDTDARYVRFDLQDGPNWRYGIRDIALKPLAFAATPNAFLSSVAADLPRGALPRAYVGEQPYWTLLGLDGGQEQALSTAGLVESGHHPVAAGPLSADRQRRLGTREGRPGRDQLRAGHAGARAADRPLPAEQSGQGRARVHPGTGDPPVAGQPADPVPQHRRRLQPHRCAGCRRTAGADQW